MTSVGSKPTKRDVLKTIKTEITREDRISNDLMSDIKAAKKLCSKLCLTFEECDLVGYIQKTISDPFGFLLISDLQVIRYLIFNIS